MSSLWMWLVATTAQVGREDRGAAAVEYGLLVGLIAVAIIATVGLLGGQLNTMFCSVVTALKGTC